MLLKAPRSTSPTRNVEEILRTRIRKDLSGCMPVIGDPSSLGTRFMQVRVLSPRLNCNFQDMRTNVKAAASPAPNGIGLGKTYVGR